MHGLNAALSLTENDPRRAAASGHHLPPPRLRKKTLPPHLHGHKDRGRRRQPPSDRALRSRQGPHFSLLPDQDGDRGRRRRLSRRQRRVDRRRDREEYCEGEEWKEAFAGRGSEHHVERWDLHSRRCRIYGQFELDPEQEVPAGGEGGGAARRSSDGCDTGGRHRTVCR